MDDGVKYIAVLVSMKLNQTFFFVPEGRISGTSKNSGDPAN